MHTLILSYNVLFLSALAAVAVFKAPSLSHIASALVFAPILFYFTRLLKNSLSSKPTKTHFLVTHPSSSAHLANFRGKSVSNSYSVSYAQRATKSHDIVEGQIVSESDVHDINKRLFLKLIGSAGLTTFLFSLFTRNSHAAFFGSVPGPGTVAIKDTAGNKIDPAEKQPTDGYEVSSVDDTSMPAYYGFMNREGAWYIARESSSGEYRYIRGASNFPSAWDSRTSHIYDYFNNVF